MKKTLFLLMGLLLVSLVTAGSLLPQMMSGTVKLPGYSSLEGLDLELRNERTGLTYITQLDSNGFYMFDWANTKYLDGDGVEISVKVCKDRPECRLRTQIREDEPQHNNLVVPSSFGVIVEKTTSYICSDGKEVATLTECPLQPERVVNVTKTVIVEKIVEKEVVKEVPREVLKEVVVKKYYCADGEQTDDAAECLDTSKRVKEYVLGAGIGFISAGFAGLVAYYVRKNKRARAKKMLDTYIKKRRK